MLNISKPRFEFVTEVQLKLSSSLIQEIILRKQGKGSAKPKFMKVLYYYDGDHGENTFFVYVSIGGKIPVYKRHFDQLRPSVQQNIQLQTELIKRKSH